METSDGNFARVQSPGARGGGQRHPPQTRLPPPPLPRPTSASAAAMMRQQSTLESELMADLDAGGLDDDDDDVDIDSGEDVAINHSRSSTHEYMDPRSLSRHISGRGGASIVPEIEPNGTAFLQSIQYTTTALDAPPPRKNLYGGVAGPNSMYRRTSETVRLSPAMRQSMDTGITIAPTGFNALQSGGSFQETKKNAQRTYLHGSFRLNSYFAIRLLRIMQLLVIVDTVALMFFYGYRRQRNWKGGSLFVSSPFTYVFSRGDSCAITISLAAMVYHLLPAVIILGLPASGFTMFEPFKREDRIGRGGRIQKVKRTIYLQICEMTAVLVFLMTGLVAIITLYHAIVGELFGCSENPGVYAFAFMALAVYVLIYVEIRYFMRFREHLKMQLGAFSEADQTGDVKAHMLRSKLRRKRVQQEIAQQNNVNKDPTADPTVAAPTAPATPARSQIVEFVRKRLYRGSQLGDIRLLKRTLRIARNHLGADFAKSMFPDAQLRMWFFSKSTKNPMHVAAYHGNIAAMELLYRANIPVNSYDKISRVRFSTGDIFWYVARYFIRQPVVSAEDTYGASSFFKSTLVTPLHCAVSTGRVDAVRWLLQHGAQVNMCSRSSYRHESRLPPIFLADHPEIAKELLAAGANHLVIPDPGHMNTITVLQMAYLRGNYAVAQVLENWGGDVALTPLHTAAAMNDTSRITQLLRKKVDPDCLGELGYIGLNKRTPLHWACVNGSIQAIKKLLDSGANADTGDARGRTPLHWAARVNQVDAVATLLKNGADPNIIDDGGMTPILCAACAGGTTEEMFKMLVNHGANINHQLPSTGDTALHIAVKLDDFQTAVALLSVGGDIMRMNHDGLRPIDCTTSTRLQFEIKRAAGNRDVMISYTHSHKEFALKLRKSLEDANITTWLDLMDPSGIGGGAVWREEIARGVSNAAMVLCILTEDYAESQWCMKELALAKQVGTPVLAISTEHAKVSEELQVYLYTRQTVPFEGAITSVERVGEKEVQYTYDEEVYKSQMRILLDGLRDEIEKRKEQVLRKNLGRAATASTMNTGGSSRSVLNASHGMSTLGGSGRRTRGVWNQGSATNTGGVAPYSTGTAQFDERAPAAMLQHNLLLESTSRRDGYLFSSANLGGFQLNERPERNLLAAHSSDEYRGLNANESMLSSTGSFLGGNADLSFHGLGMNDLTGSVILNPSGYYEHQQPRSHTVGNGSVLETFKEVEDVVGEGQQFVFICHGDWHTSFVKRLCAALCREGGLHCYVDRRRGLGRSGSKAGTDVTSPSSLPPPATENDNEDHSNEDMFARIHDAKEAILKCSAFVVVLSEKTLRTQLVKDQLAFAEDKGKKIIPVVVNPLEFSLDMKYSLSRSDFFHFFTGGDMIGFEKSLNDVLGALREEIYGISVERESRRIPKTFSFGQVSSFSGHDDSGGLQSIGPTDVSIRRRPSVASMSGGGDTGSVTSSNRTGWGPEVSSSARRNLSFIGVDSPPVRPLNSDMSLQQAMLGNFSTLMRRITDTDDDEMDAEEEVGLVLGDDDDDDLEYEERLPELHRSVSEQAYLMDSNRSFQLVESNRSFLSSEQEIMSGERSPAFGLRPIYQSRPGRLSSIMSNSGASVSILERGSDESSTIEAVRAAHERSRDV